jgi:hypothetical protein
MTDGRYRPTQRGGARFEAVMVRTRDIVERRAV